MTIFSKARILNRILLGFAAGALAIQAVSASGPYLEAVGPPPMRYQVVVAPNPSFLAKLALPSQQATQEPATAMPGADDQPPDNNAAPPVPWSNPVPGDNSGGSFSIPAKNAESAPNPASDLLNITPQMINEYFKPNRRGDDNSGPYQRGESILVPSEMGFVPPMPGGSRAIYQSR